MLQIKKKSLLYSIKYNLKFLFKNKKLSDHYKMSKNITQSITLRSPKHFNIGKHKILNLNYQTKNALFILNKKIKLYSFLSKNDSLFNLSTKAILLTPTLSVSSLHLNLRTKFKITWLET